MVDIPSRSERSRIGLNKLLSRVGEKAEAIDHFDLNFIQLLLTRLGFF